MFKCLKPVLVLFVALSLMVLLMSSAHAEKDYLAPEVAFIFSARMADPKTAEVTYVIADGYYMYRERSRFQAEGAILGDPKIALGVVKYDLNFQKNVETYHYNVTIKIPVKAATAFTMIVTGQGCADKGLCYPPR